MRKCLNSRLERLEQGARRVPIVVETGVPQPDCAEGGSIVILVPQATRAAHVMPRSSGLRGIDGH